MLNTLNLVWGVQCFHYDRFTTTDETIEDCTDILKKEGYVQAGDSIINTASIPHPAAFPHEYVENYRSRIMMNDACWNDESRVFIIHHY